MTSKNKFCPGRLRRWLIGATLCLSLGVHAGVTSKPPAPAEPGQPGCPSGGSGGFGGPGTPGGPGGTGGSIGMVVCGLASNVYAAAQLHDTPLLSTAIVGPGTAFSLSYATRGRQTPASLPGGNAGPGWWHNWQAWLEDVPATPGQNVKIFARDGGHLSYTGYVPATGSFAPEPTSQAKLILSSTNPVQYQRILPDGNMEVYAQAETLAAGKRRLRLSAVTDPQGRSVQLTYDEQGRLSRLTDALGRVTSFDYDNEAFPQSITRVTDFGGRQATLSYDAHGRLQSITDVIGLTSQMAYDAAGAISSVTTPYGTTQIITGQNGYRWWSQITDPLGHTERQEMMHGAPGLSFSLGADQIPSVPNAPGVFNSYMSSRNSFYWNKTTMSAMGASIDYKKGAHPPLATCSRRPLCACQYP